MERREDSDWSGAERLGDQVKYPLTMTVRHALFDAAVIEQDCVALFPELLPKGECCPRLFSTKHVCPCHVRTVGLKCLEPRPKYQSSFTGKQADFNVDTRRTQRSCATFAARGGVKNGNDHAGELGVDERLTAGRRPALVVAGLQRDYCGSAFGQATSSRKGMRFGVWFAFAFVVALPDDISVRSDDDAADRRIRAGCTEAKRRQRDSAPHGVTFKRACHCVYPA